MAAASQFYTTGPAYVWSSALTFNWTTPASNTWNFIGYSRNGFDVSIVPQYEDVEADYAGRSPADVSILGQEGRLAGVFSRYNEGVLLGLAAFRNGDTAGSGPNNALGSLLRAEGFDFALLVQCPYYAKPAYGTSPSPMIPGFLFYSAHMYDPYNSLLSIRPKMPNIGFRAIPVFGSVVTSTFTPNAAPLNAYELYSTAVPLAATGSAAWPTVD